MTQIGTTEWDTELMTDRVDVIRMTGVKAPSGQNKPTESVIHSSVPCKFIYGSGTEQVTSIAELASDMVMVGFAEDVSLKNGDLLRPVPPSVGSYMRVGPYRFDSTLNFFAAVCTRAT